ncbi:MAG: transcription antitermination factor NusB [Bacteroidota bacterium]|jgi:N utilization substance protein B|nr:transcription antitermination factor NusB [Bacteroidota bacterium]MEC8678866.1 transcription antitermination factor NusB [Bacteroidota bacterium]MEC8702782.1 transcription antitermination factor NusB [Bacteroidota bacterium]|tara:strand:+ start:523 stop:1485 length:963 start_codon:yes stop_codon:yes gene_type:complete
MINRRSLRVKVLQLLFSYYNQVVYKEDKKKLQLEISKQLHQSILDIEKPYFEVISLLIVLKNINEEKKQIAKKELIKKSTSRFNLSGNRIINFLEKNTQIIDGLIKHKNGWNTKTEKIRNWYNVLLQEEFYKNYVTIEKPKFEEDFDFLQNLIVKFLFKNNDIQKSFEEENIFWNEDFLIIKSMIKKTLKTLNSSNFNTFATASLSEDIKDDIKFACSLFDCVIDNSTEYDGHISKYAKNWDIERISLMDRTILRMGIGEMVNFSNIPVKVSINECIDIAKNYSSPKSGKFINGLLDVISLNLLKEKKIIKTGKGLIDNK